MSAVRKSIKDAMRVNGREPLRQKPEEDIMSSGALNSRSEETPGPASSLSRCGRTGYQSTAPTPHSPKAGDVTPRKLQRERPGLYCCCSAFIELARTLAFHGRFEAEMPSKVLDGLLSLVVEVPSRYKSNGCCLDPKASERLASTIDPKMRMSVSLLAHVRTVAQRCTAHKLSSSFQESYAGSSNCLCCLQNEDSCANSGRLGDGSVERRRRFNLPFCVSDKQSTSPLLPNGPSAAPQPRLLASVAPSDNRELGLPDVMLVHLT